MRAVEARTTADGEWGDNAVAGFKVLETGACFCDVAEEFVAHYEICFGDGWWPPSKDT